MKTMRKKESIFYIIFSAFFILGIFLIVHYTDLITDAQERYKLVVNFGMMLTTVSAAFMILFYSFLRKY